MADTTAATMEDVGVFTRDQVEILSTRKGEPDWLREQRAAAYGMFAETPMPDTRPEEWRYTPIASLLKLDALRFAEDAKPVGRAAELPGEFTAEGVVLAAGLLAQTDASVVFGAAPEGADGVIFCSLEQAVREHPERVRESLGSAVLPEHGKFAAMNAAFWTGGLFLYVPRGVRVEGTLRGRRWISEAGTAVFGRTLVVAEEGAEVTLVEEFASPDFDGRTLSVGAVEIIAGENARVNYVAVQRWGRGVLHLTTDRIVAGRDARVTTLNVALGTDVARSDIQCRLQKPGSHVDMLGLYIGQDTQHLDFQTLQDHLSPHASSNLLFKGALGDRAHSVFRGLIRVHPGAQRTDAYQTNRNLILSPQARADSLPNLEIQADDVRCSHAATVGQLDEEEIFYLLSRGIRKPEAMRLVIFGFFGEVLDQLPQALEETKRELVGMIEQKLDAMRG